MDYALLNPSITDQILNQRLANLEAEHFETMLLAEEAEAVGADNAPQYRAHAEQVAQRIAFVRERLAPPPPPPPADADAEPKPKKTRASRG